MDLYWQVKGQQVKADAMMSFVQESYPKFEIQSLGTQELYQVPLVSSIHGGPKLAQEVACKGNDKSGMIESTQEFVKLFVSGPCGVKQCLNGPHPSNMLVGGGGVQS